MLMKAREFCYLSLNATSRKPKKPTTETSREVNVPINEDKEIAKELKKYCGFVFSLFLTIIICLNLAF